MNNPNINIGIINESSVISETIVGKLLLTDEGKQYIVKSDGSKLKFTDIQFVSSLPSIGLKDILYILKSNNTINYYDSTTTSWINISASVDTSTLLDKTTYKGSADGIVKKADTLTNMTSTVSQIDNTVNNSISVDTTNRENGKVIGWNNGQNEYLDINVSGIVGSTGNLVSAGANVSISPLSEVIFVHPTSTDDKIMINVQQQVVGGSVSDTNMDFSDSSKYILQDSNEIVFKSNSAKLKDGASCINTYKFNEVSGTVCTDSKGLYNGTYFGTTSVIGSVGSARSFNGTASDYISFSNPVIPLGKKSVKTKIKFTTNGDLYFMNNSGHSTSNYGFAIGVKLGKITVFLSKGTNGIYNFALESTSIINDNNWHTILFIWDGTVDISSAKLYIDNVLEASATPLETETHLASSNLCIGKSAIGGIGDYYIGEIDELEIYDEVIDSVMVSPLYIQTVGVSNLSLTTIGLITSITSTVTTPTNTSVKVLFSVDKGLNWLYRSGSIIYKYTGDLTLAWTNSNQWSEISTYFTNLNLTTLTNDLSSLGIIPTTLDFSFQLFSSTTSETPSVGKITIDYDELNHTELASFGGYGESNVMFGVKRISPTQLGIKNNSSTTKIASVNVLLGTV